MNKPELISAIADEADLTKADAGRTVDFITSSITGSLKDAVN
jgi:DNA-binding protein HU-beta